MLKGLMSRVVRLGAAAAMAAAAMPAVQPVAADGGVMPPPVVTKQCVFENRTPAPGSRVRPVGGAVRIAVSGFCNEPAGRVRVFLDGVERTAEGGGRDEFHFAEFFEAPNLRRGLHRVFVQIEDNGSTAWSFTVIR